MLEETESGNAGTQLVKEYSSNSPKKLECFASAFLFSDFFGMFPCLKKSRSLGQSPVFVTATNFVIFEKFLSRGFTSLTFVSLIISIQTKDAVGKEERIFPQHAKEFMQIRQREILGNYAEKNGSSPRIARLINLSLLAKLRGMLRKCGTGRIQATGEFFDKGFDGPLRNMLCHQRSNCG